MPRADLFGFLWQEHRVELAKQLAKQGEHAPPRQLKTDDALKIIQRKCDQLGTVRGVFRNMDKHHSGVIAKEELAEALRPMEFQLTPDQVAASVPGPSACDVVLAMSCWHAPLHCDA